MPRWGKKTDSASGTGPDAEIVEIEEGQAPAVSQDDGRVALYGADQDSTAVPIPVVPIPAVPTQAEAYVAAQAPAVSQDDGPAALYGADQDSTADSTSGIAPTAAAYAAARASMASKMLGPRWGPLAESDPERLHEELRIPTPEAPEPEAPPQPTTRYVPVAAVTPEPLTEAPPPRRHRRTLVVIGGLLFAVVLSVVGTAVLSMMPRQESDPTIGVVDPSVRDTPSRAPTASPTRKPTPAPTKKPTPRPTPRPTRRPTPRPTPKPTPAMFATWVSIATPPVPPVFTVRTRPGAVCTITRIRVGGTTPRTSPTFTANGAGTAVLSNWNTYPWNHGSTYTVTAACILAGKSASTPARTVAIA